MGTVEYVLHFAHKGRRWHAVFYSAGGVSINVWVDQRIGWVLADDDEDLTDAEFEEICRQAGQRIGAVTV